MDEIRRDARQAIPSSYRRLVWRRQAGVSPLSVGDYCVSIGRHRTFGMRKLRSWTPTLTEAALLFACAALVPFGRTQSQGLSGASLEGTVTSDSAAIVGATVTLTDLRAGISRR